MTKREKQISFHSTLNTAFANRNDKRTELDIAIEWIKKNLSPDEVFPRGELLMWLDENKESLENKYPVTEY